MAASILARILSCGTWSHGESVINCPRRDDLIAYLPNRKTPLTSLNSDITYLRTVIGIKIVYTNVNSAITLDAVQVIFN